MNLFKVVGLSLLIASSFSSLAQNQADEHADEEAVAVDAKVDGQANSDEEEVLPQELPAVSDQDAVCKIDGAPKPSFCYHREP